MSLLPRSCSREFRVITLAVNDKWSLIASALSYNRNRLIPRGETLHITAGRGRGVRTLARFSFGAPRFAARVVVTLKRARFNGSFRGEAVCLDMLRWWTLAIVKNESLKAEKTRRRLLSALMLRDRLRYCHCKLQPIRGRGVFYCGVSNLRRPFILKRSYACYCIQATLEKNA